jgi:hypothetical protein
MAAFVSKNVESFKSAVDDGRNENVEILFCYAFEAGSLAANLAAAGPAKRNVNICRQDIPPLLKFGPQEIYRPIEPFFAGHGGFRILREWLG